MDKKFLVFKSSAGSGKTYTLVREYLSLALSEPDKYKNILAITFTNKAADEMKQRVLSNLKELSSSNDNNSSLLKKLCESLNLPEPEIVRRAKALLTSILHNYSDFAIGTIDSFVHKIIKTFAHDLYIPADFEVEMDENKLLRQAIDILISKAGTDENLTKLLVEYIENQAEIERSWHIEEDMRQLASSLLKEEGQVYLEKIKNINIEDYFDIIKKIRESIAGFENEITKHAAQAIELIKIHNISNESFAYGNTGIGSYFRNLAEGNYDKIKPGTRLINIVEGEKWHSGKTSQADKEEINSIKEQLKDYYLKIQELIGIHLSKYILFQLIFKDIYPLAVLNEIKKIIDTIKAENKILHISEFNKIISGIVMKEPVPFIYERTGEKYRHFLIDEFQDTSQLQWTNLLPLIDNSLSENNLNMIVGDGKQAIYRWRNGDVEQFINLPKIPINAGEEEATTEKWKKQIIEERQQNLERNYKKQELGMNYRSQKVIVEFNNNFFRFISSNLAEEYRDMYNLVNQTYMEGKEGGFVQIEFLDAKRGNENEESSQDSDSATLQQHTLNEEKKNFEDLNLQKIKEIIEELKKDNFSLKDIAILCRSNKNASVTAQYLLTNGIDVVSKDSLLLLNSPAVNFIISCLRYIDNKDNKIAEAEIDFFLRIYQNSSVTNKTLLLSLNWNTGIYDLCETIIRMFNLNKGSHVNPYLTFFLDAVHEYSVNNQSNISDFLTWWEEHSGSLSLVVPEELDAVKILTIHKSKGLQFPVVIYPFATESFKNTKERLWVELHEEKIPNLKVALLKNTKALSETEYEKLYNTEFSKSKLDLINLLYVTMTRAEERIYVLTKLPDKNTENKNSITDIFVEYFKSTDDWSDDKKIYTKGKAAIKKLPDSNDSNSVTELKELISNDWKNEIIIRAQAPEIWDTENPEHNLEYGNILHTALSRIKYSEDLDDAVASLVSDGLIDDSEQQKILKTLVKLFKNQEISRFFQKEEGTLIKTEAEILTQDGKIFRPDRVILKGEKAVVIDFKTGKREDYHIKQIKQYEELLRESGYKEIESYLVYTEEGEALLISN